MAASDWGGVDVVTTPVFDRWRVELSQEYIDPPLLYTGSEVNCFTRM